jgi:dihydrolipoamide dehydrogenase
MVDEVSQEVLDESKGIENGIESSENHTLYRTKARFEENKKIRLDTGELITAPRIVIAAGTRPMVPDIEGVENVDYLTSKTALRHEEKMESVTIVGGGYIACEMAHFWNQMGVEVTIVQGPEYLADAEDQDISKKITEKYSQKMDVNTGSFVQKLRNENGDVVAETEDGQEFRSEEVLIATGRTPNTDSLELSETDIETDDKGFVKTNDYLETTVEGIYALGDIAGEFMLKHSANHEASVVYKNTLVGNEFKPDYSAMPHAIFSSPQVSGVGKKESEVDEEYVTAKYGYSDTGMGDALKADGFVKVISSTEGDILGCHIIGPEASSIIHEVIVAKQNDLGIEGIKDTVHIHPALNEVVDRAFQKL